MRRTHRCGELRSTDAGCQVLLQGWVWRRRDMGGLLFIDLRDRSGAVQCVFNPEYGTEVHAVAQAWRPEWVVEVEGEVTERPPETVNANLATGAIEIRVQVARTLAVSKTPPFVVEEEAGASEELRLRYRFLDLRRPPLQRHLKLRHRMSMATRNYLDEQGFLEIETPMLTRSTPEGARDYLVPSRLHSGSFYALPQSPQLFKQLLMVSGFDRYFQLARCFRDEDLRANRQPEFTQIDIEMSFVEPEDVMELTEGIMKRLLEVSGHDSDVHFERLDFRQALDRFGSDKPDLRFDHEVVDVTEEVRDCGFRAFAEVARAGGAIKALRYPGGASVGRARLDRLSEVARGQRAKGLVWILSTDAGLDSPVGKYLGDRLMSALAEAAGVGRGDALLLVADEWEIAARAMGSVRSALAASEGWIEPGLCFVWVVEFPLLEFDAEANRMVARHHPFTAPHPDDLELLADEPLSVRACSYDLVLNGVELGGGSIRNHLAEVQQEVFTALGMSSEEARDRFGFLLDALAYGAPPHGGIAMGYDRIVMMLAGQVSLRTVIAFPKTTSATDLMTEAPAPVDAELLESLHLRTKPTPAGSDDNDD
ncbi:MAG: aspartate--tRNA ligase [Acidobacteriota bacterium]